MVKKYSKRVNNKTKTKSKRGSRSRHMGGANSPSAWDYVQNVVGTPNVQSENALSIRPGEGIVSMTSNNIEPVKDYHLQSGGRRKKGRTKRGGSWAATINQTLVPFSLWGMQYFSKSKKQPYKRNSYKRKKTFRR
jgi:hypothetical protein